MENYLEAAEKAGFEVLLSTDTNLPHQQNLSGRRLAVVILGKNRWALIKEKLREIAEAVAAAKPGTYSFVEILER